MSSWNNCPASNHRKRGPCVWSTFHLQLKTWFGKFIVGIIGVAVMLVAFFLSILAFAIIASIVAVAMIYFLWAARRARRTMRNQTADGILQSRDIQ